MRNDRLKISLYLFIATIVFLVPGFIWGAQGMTNDHEDNCHTPPGKEGADCKMFNDGVCLKGKLGPVGPGGKRLCIHNANPGAAVPDDSPIVTAVREAHAHVFGKEPGIGAVPWHSDAN